MFMVTKKKSSEAPLTAAMAVYEHTFEALKEVEKKLKISEASAAIQYRISTGSLALDLLSGGGLTPGMITLFGWEQTCKTTTALNIIASTLPKKGQDPKVPLLAFWDFENGAQDPAWLETIMKSMGTNLSLEEVFGIRDGKGGYTLKPKLIYRDDGTGEVFFRWFGMLQRRLPDKIYLDGSWWYVYPKDTKAELGDLVDSKMSKLYGDGLYVKALDGNPQAIVLVDSYPAMIPESVEDNVEDGKNSGLGVIARMFASELPKVKGLLKKKRIIFLGINQLRDIPMAMFGPKDQEAAGKALRFFSDARYRMDALGLTSVPHFSPKGEKGIEVESSIYPDSPEDKYKYIRVRAVKNKLGPQQREVWLRLWISDHKKQPRGYDQVFDTMFYLKSTGQLSGNRKALSIVLKGNKLPELSWMVVKKWILGDKELKAKINQKLKLKDTFDLRAFCFKQMQTGEAQELYLTASAGKDVASQEE